MTLKRKTNINRNNREGNIQAIIVGANIWNLRKKSGLSQSELAEYAGTTQRIISIIEDGSYNFGEDLVSRIANVLGVGTDVLFKNINWTELEVIDIILKRAYEIGKNTIDILGIMKLYFFIDYCYNKEFGRLLQDRLYIRYKHGPYNKELYKDLLNEQYAIFYTLNDELDNIGHTYSEFSLSKKAMQSYSNIDTDDFNFINSILDDYIHYDSQELKDLSYKIPEMIALGATQGGMEGFYQKIL